MLNSLFAPAPAGHGIFPRSIATSPATLLWLFLSLTSILVLPGCGGCLRDPLVEGEQKSTDDEKKKKEQEEDFEFQLAHTVPSDETLATPLVKPGHWVTFMHDIKSNQRDVAAELHTLATDRTELPFLVDGTPFRLASSRPAPLPKGQEKRFESPFFIPRPAPDAGKTAGLYRELRASPSGSLLKKDWQPVLEMAGYQYFFLVLASDPDRYGYLKRLSAISAPTAGDLETEAYVYYRVLLPQFDRLAPLPSNALTWTSLAYILWDDIDPNIFTTEQNQALLDWVHWGGQLIVSGPNSLEKLQSSFLADHLPATATSSFEIGQAAIDEINQHWALPDKQETGRRVLEIAPNQPLIGVRLDKHPLSLDLPHTGGLLVERRLGAGRIVVSALSLTDRAVVNWSSFDSFFNACLLRRPRREFSFENYLPDSRWADYPPVMIRDARLVTSLRYFTRDVGHFASQVRGRSGLEPGEEIVRRETAMTPPIDENPEDVASLLATSEVGTPDNDAYFTGYPFRPKSGMAAWNDQSGASDAARDALKVAAGISIPNGAFVFKVLTVYLIVLAPVNWGFFRLLGRVEWAWVAAPVMAIVGAMAVIRLAQLDIGFARSVTEVGIVEVQADYPRAHITRYTALYTSLSSSYDLNFAEEGALAQPFSARTDFVLGLNDPTYTVSLRRDRELHLSGFQVASNSTGTVHCEQMSDLGGSFRLETGAGTAWSVHNGTPFTLQGAGVLRRTEQGVLERAWLGELTSGISTPLRFESASDSSLRFPEWDNAPVTASVERQVELLLARWDANGDEQLDFVEAASEPTLAANWKRIDVSSDGQLSRAELMAWYRDSRAGDLSLGQLVDLASLALRLRPGDVRLIGWTDEHVPGMIIRPAAAQEVRRNLFLVHLRRGELPTPRPDVNCLADVIPESALLESNQDNADNPLEK